MRTVLVWTAVVGMVVVSRSTAVEVTVTSVLWTSVVRIVVLMGRGTRVQLVEVT
jgi:hypothetical protein